MGLQMECSVSTTVSANLLSYFLILRQPVVPPGDWAELPATLKRNYYGTIKVQ